MPVEVMPVRSALESKQLDLQNPEFPFLRSDPQLVRFLAFQPIGTVIASANRVGPRDSALMGKQIHGLLRKANELSVDLAICPEYCCPWPALIGALTNGLVPLPGKLWVIGCESATAEQFNAHVAALNPYAVVIFEQAALVAQGNFVNPVCFVFNATDVHGTQKLIVLVQFKTYQMGDPQHFEFHNLKVGSRFYKFSNQHEHCYSLLTLLCSDSLNPDLANPIFGFTFIPERSYFICN